MEVNYSWDEMQISSRPVAGNLLAAPFFLKNRKNGQIDDELLFELEPEKIQLSDTVRVSWNLL